LIIVEIKENNMSSVNIAGDVSGAISIAAPSAAGSGVLTLPVATDTLIGKATTDTLTNKTLVAPALGTPASGLMTNVTGTASGLTAGNVTTNANLTGPITSVGNATSIASQTGTGTKFVVDTSPTLVTPALGNASATGLTSAKVNSGEGATGIIANGATGALFTLAEAGCYIVTARQDGAVNGGIRAFAFVAQGSSSNATTSLAASSCTISSGSGFVVNITNNAGGDATFRWSYTRLSS
jgi:hypothetical protein